MSLFRMKRKSGEILAHMKIYGSVIITLDKFEVT
jgi:hypothetical protein